ncbi:predicted protein [Chaetoceros tenuissimus]|uniref:F-box domain-containing protein n=1 Tax=Chaetoceros tenuissimus TaxID=426638 RepID=A0AAD3DBJ7_9STRA|nr:predicted protein [Chaetoceros tenuissimus]
MNANTNEHEADVVNTCNNSTIQFPTILPQAFLIAIVLLIAMNAVIVASTRKMSTNVNEQHEGNDLITKSKSNSSIPLPTHILRHCLSFLGSSDNYYFLASVSKDFKTVVEQLYGDNRNTSAESIIATVSRCNHVIDLIMGDTELAEEEKAVIAEKIAKVIFYNDKVVIFEQSVMPKCETSEGIRKIVGYAITERSTEIMRTIIKNKENVQIMKDQMVEDGVPLAVFVSAACDVSMIKELIDHGVEFKGESLVFALNRDDLQTFEYLLDTVEVYTEPLAIIRKALVHQKYIDAFEMLMTKECFRVIDLRIVLLRLVVTSHATLDLVQFLLGHSSHEIEIDESFFRHLIFACIEERRMDLLTYINSSIQEINVESCILFFQAIDDEETVEFLRDLL